MEQRRSAMRKRRPPIARVIAFLRRFDFDDVSAEISEDRARIGSCDAMAKLDHSDARERQPGRGFFVHAFDLANRVPGVKGRVPSTLASMQPVDTGLERALKHAGVGAVAENSEAPIEILPPGLHVAAEEARDLLVALAGAHQCFRRGLVARMIELAIDA